MLMEYSVKLKIEKMRRCIELFKKNRVINIWKTRNSEND